MFRLQYAPAKLPNQTVVRRRPGLDFSVTGVVYVGMMLFMGLAAINSQANLLFGVFGLMIGILVVSGFISRLVLKKLHVTRSFPESGCVGETLTLIYQITNGKRFWPSLSISIAELDGSEAFTTQPQGYMLHAAPHMTASVPSLVIPKRRGLHTMDHYQIATSFPFGFVKRARTERYRDSILIYPPIARVDPKLLSMCRSVDASGETMRPRPGGSDEFYGVKDYRPGDNPRRIYWRRSARSGTLVSKQMTQSAPPRIALLVDTCLEGTSLEAHAAVERCIAMAASVATVALERGQSVGLCAWSEDWVLLPPTRGKRHREDVLSILARLSRNTERPLQELLEKCQSVLHTGTTPILFTPRDVQLGIAEGSRQGMIVIPADSDRARAWFRFDPGIDFRSCMPVDQAVKEKGDAGTRGRGDARKENGTDSPSFPASSRPRVPASPSRD
ncbi:MAG TPA: DUF58 domain-containing protein [Tepidisphaeraceae bacterium]|nr:DUF58 domain-containing protein [Tepidisphaeraceae bacterium]